jgi:hypothetical protein
MIGEATEKVDANWVEWDGSKGEYRILRNFFFGPHMKHICKCRITTEVAGWNCGPTTYITGFVPHPLIT